jgi:Astacin (Peptidase family M12A)
MVYPDPASLGSESSTGMHLGAQLIWVSSTITATAGGALTIAHEICHCLGLLHEQNRSDRNSFVTVNFSNIAVIHRDQFSANPLDLPSNFGSYDKLSIMHYKRRAYATNPSVDTITPLAAPPPLVVSPPTTTVPSNQDFGSFTPSAGDIAAVNFMYPPSASFGESSDTGPALTSRGDTLMLAWKGNGNSGLSTMISKNGNVFSAKATLSERTTNAPALAVHGANFVIAWTGEGNNKLNVMQSTDGSTWFGKVTLSDTSPSTPALAHIGAEIFLAWRGGDNRLNLIRSLDGVHWSPKQTIGDTTDSGPALCSSGANLLLVWRGRGNNNLNVITAPGGIITSGPGGIFPPGHSKVTLNDTTDDRPAICRTDSHVYLAWQGTGNDFMNVMKSSDGKTWGTKITVSAEHTKGGPAIASWSHLLVRAWTESGAQGNLRSRAFQEF